MADFEEGKLKFRTLFETEVGALLQHNKEAVDALHRASKYTTTKRPFLMLDQHTAKTINIFLLNKLSEQHSLGYFLHDVGIPCLPVKYWYVLPSASRTPSKFAAYSWSCSRKKRWPLTCLH